jgi:hypothetical protein
MNRLLLVVVLGFATFPVQAAEATPPAVAADDVGAIAAVQVADDQRTQAMVSADRQALGALLSDELVYGHSNGQVDTKSSLIAALADHRMVYERFDYRERVFVPAGPGMMLMRGRVIATIRNGEHRVPLDLQFLAVWREENKRWRFLAWQSARRPDERR